MRDIGDNDEMGETRTVEDSGGVSDGDRETMSVELCLSTSRLSHQHISQSGINREGNRFVKYDVSTILPI